MKHETRYTQDIPAVDQTHRARHAGPSAQGLHRNENPVRYQIKMFPRTFLDLDIVDEPDHP